MKNLPNAKKVLGTLNAYLIENAPALHSDEMQDHFRIERIEPGKLWLEPLTADSTVIGPFPVPKQITALCVVGWKIGGIVAEAGRCWQLIEVWNVSP